MLVNGKATGEHGRIGSAARPQLSERQDDRNESGNAADSFEGPIEAIRMIRDMVMQLGAQARAELMGDPQIREFAARCSNGTVRQKQGIERCEEQQNKNLVNLATSDLEKGNVK